MQRSRIPDIGQITQDTRKALLPPEPPSISRADAIAMFGLSEGFTHEELNQRRRQMHDAAGTQEMIEVIELAYLRLSEREEA